MARLPRITLVRRIKASPEDLFTAWTRPEHLTRWWRGGIRGVAQCEPKRGGSFLVAGYDAEGEAFEDWGSFTVVIPGEVLEFSWKGIAGESRVTMQLLALAYTTELTLVHFDLPDEAIRDRQEARWVAGLAALEALVDPAPEV